MTALVAAGTLSQASQYLLSFLFSVSPDKGPKYSIRAALGLTPYFFSMLVGYTSGAPRALTQFLAGQAGSSDRVMEAGSRRARAVLLGGALATQALGTSLIGASRSRAQLVCAQIVIGLGSGPLYPMGYSIIAVSYPPSDLGTPNGVLSQTTYFGPALSSLAVVVARAYGWRLTAKAVAVSLMTAAIAVVVVADDDDLAQSTSKNSRVETSIEASRPRQSRARLAAATLVALGGGARYAAGYAVPSYVPYFFEVKYPSKTNVFAACNAAAIFACGSSSALAGGAIAQAFARRRHLSSRARDYLVVPIISCFLGGLFAAAVFSASSFGAAVAALFVMQLAGEAWLAGTVAGLRILLDDDAALGAFYTVATFVGCLNLVLLGYAVDDSTLSLKSTMITDVALPYLLAVLFFAAAHHVAPSDDQPAPRGLRSPDVDDAPALLKSAPSDATPLLPQSTTIVV